MADTILAIFPPFPTPGFVPNFTGYDLDQQNIDWYDFYKTVATDEDPVYVSLELFTFPLLVRPSVFSSSNKKGKQINDKFDLLLRK